MIDFIIWLCIVVLFIISFVGLIYPIIPSSLFIWIGFLLYHFLVHDSTLTIFFWSVMAGLTILLLLADVIANSYFVKRHGGSKWGERGAAVAVIVGSFIVPPLGVIIVPFITVLLIEMIQRNTVKKAFKTALGSLFGFLGGTMVKAIIQFIMIVWFIMYIII